MDHEFFTLCEDERKIAFLFVTSCYARRCEQKLLCEIIYLCINKDVGVALGIPEEVAAAASSSERS